MGSRIERIDAATKARGPLAAPGTRIVSSGNRWGSIRAQHVHTPATEWPEGYLRHNVILPEMLGASAERVELRPVFGVEDRLVFQLLMALRDELRAEHPAGRLYAETLGNALAAHVSQKYGTAPPARDRRGGLAPHRLRLVKDYVDTHLGRNFGLPELAALAQMKVDSFIRAFKQSMGVPPHRYVLIRRIDRATTLLRVGGRSIPEIAAVSGFGSQSSFTRAFRRLIGVTPREYRTSL